ncbi:MAG: hypothetical protein AAGF11_15580 [Myxococcota bacterium]
MISISNNTTPQRRRTVVTALFPSMLGVALLAGCSVSDSIEGLEDVRQDNDGECSEELDLRVNQGAWNGSSYAFGHDSVSTIRTTGAPADVDDTRWAMLHDGSGFYQYFMNTAGDKVHQFKWNGTAYAYQNKSIPVVGYPSEADKSSFAMLHDGEIARLYFLNGAKNRLIQGAFNSAQNAFVHGHQSADFPVNGIPGDADFTGWGMLHSGGNYHLYSYAGGPNAIYQYVYNPQNETYEFGPEGFHSRLDITGFPGDSNLEDFAMLHDGDAYRFYVQGLSTCFPCAVEGACDDCTPGPTGLCPEHIDAAIDMIGGEDMQEHGDDIVDHINDGEVPDDDWAGHDDDIHLIQAYHPQFNPDPRGPECHDAKVDLGTELVLDTAAVVSDLFFFKNYFTQGMRNAAKPVAQQMVHELVHENDFVKVYVAAANTANEASRVEKAGEMAFKLLGANGFTHVMFEGMKARYDLHHRLGRWHLAADILVGAATVISVIVPETWPAWVLKLTGFLRTVTDVANLGVDLKINLENYHHKCGGDNCGDGTCGQLDYSYGCIADCQADYDAACSGGCGSYTGGDELCDAYCNQCNNNSVCEPGFGEDSTTCPSDCS